MPPPAPSECWRGPEVCRWCAKAEREKTFVMRDGALHSPASGRSENPVEKWQRAATAKGWDIHDDRSWGPISYPGAPCHFCGKAAFEDDYPEELEGKVDNEIWARHAGTGPGDQIAHSSCLARAFGGSYAGSYARVNNPDLLLLGNPSGPRRLPRSFSCPDKSCSLHTVSIGGPGYCEECGQTLVHDDTGRIPTTEEVRRLNPSLLLLGNPGPRSKNPQKLLRKEDLRNLPALYSQENNPDPTVWVKFFTPWAGWTWYCIEYDGADTLFGLTDGHEMELGYISLSELQGLRGPGGLRVERDIHWKPTPLSKVKSREVNPAPTAPQRIKKAWEKFHFTDFGKARAIHRKSMSGVPEELFALGQFIDITTATGGPGGGRGGSLRTLSGSHGDRLCYAPEDQSLWIVLERPFSRAEDCDNHDVITAAYRTFKPSHKDAAVYEHKFHRPYPVLRWVNSAAAMLDGGRYIVTDWIRK